MVDKTGELHKISHVALGPAASLKKRDCNTTDCPMYSKQTNKMWSSKNLVMLKCQSRTSLHTVQYK